MLSALQNIVEHNENIKETRLETLAKPCPFCNKRLAKYVCPRCKRGYCSLECYRTSAHSACWEGFHREQMMEEDERTKASEEEKKKMLEVLKKYEFQAPEDGGALEFVGNPEPVATVELEEADFGDSANLDEVDDSKEEDEDEETARRQKDLERRMTGLNIEEADFEEIWERLNSGEREEFVRLARELEKEENKNTLNI
jgi:hypothetical protein